MRRCQTDAREEERGTINLSQALYEVGQPQTISQDSRSFLNFSSVCNVHSLLQSVCGDIEVLSSNPGRPAESGWAVRILSLRIACVISPVPVALRMIFRVDLASLGY